MAERNPSILRGKPNESERAPEVSAGSPAQPTDPEPAGSPGQESGQEPDPQPQARAPSALRAVSLGPEAPSARASRSSRVQRPVFHVAGFWHRMAAAAIDLAILLPVSLIMAWLAGALSGVHLPASRHYGIDFWLDLLLVGDPALIGITVITLAIATVYVLVFQITLAYTPGMRLMKLRIIDPYGDRPTTSRAAIRTSGYLVSVLTLGLGFLWVGFDSEKRGLHDWIAGTHVVKA